MKEEKEIYHPLCLIYPFKEKLLDDLAEDIKKSGLIEPIVRYNGLILDGRHRYLACKKVNVIPTYIDLPLNIEPLQYLKSKHNRRDLTAIERIEIELKFDNWTPIKEEIKETEDKKIAILTQRRHDKKIAKASHTNINAVRKVKEIEKITESNPKIQKEIEKLKKTESIDTLYRKAKQPNKPIRQIKKEKKSTTIIQGLQDSLKKKEQEIVSLRKTIALIKEELIKRKIWTDIEKIVYSKADITKSNIPSMKEERKAELIK